MQQSLDNKFFIEILYYVITQKIWKAIYKIIFLFNIMTFVDIIKWPRV